MPNEDSQAGLVLAQRIEGAIQLIRGEKVMLDADLAALYEVTTGAFNQAVKRNLDRFPADFMFQLTWDEAMEWNSHFITSDAEPLKGSRSQNVILKRGSNPKYRPHAFTEQGVAMLSSVLRSDRAVLVNIEIMRAFVRMRQILAAHAELSRKLTALEKKYDAQFKVVFDAIRQLMAPPKQTKSGKIGFGRANDT